MNAREAEWVRQAADTFATLLADQRFMRHVTFGMIGRMEQLVATQPKPVSPRVVKLPPPDGTLNPVPVKNRMEPGAKQSRFLL